MALLVPVIVLATGCAVSSEPTPTGSPAVSSAPVLPAQGAPPTSGPSVADPKDIRGIAPCEVLTGAQLRQLDLVPESAREFADDVAPGCAWSSATDDTNPVGLEINSNSALAVLDLMENLRDNFDRYEPTAVAGHPAIRADDDADNSCSLVIAVADHQGIGIGYNDANRPLPDPCELPRRMGEFILSNLPPLD